jgi:hypothetical protein
MPRPAGLKRTPLERLRQSRTAMIRSLDYQARKHVEDITSRQEKIARLTAEIETLEKEEQN